ncbi:MAG: hypothetical protein J6X77_02060 [Bacteroidales bacterium]|nr:hypothetical protein [Bacteroidales bacterium]
MKKSFILILSLAVCTAASAQSMYDAYTFAENNYIGTARSAGLANAVTALGGDLGTIGINPAGSAVAGYSQFTITPALSLSVGRTHYALSPTSAYQEGQNTFNPVFKLPNVGATARYDTDSDVLRSFTFGFVLNTVTDYNSRMVGSGLNSMSSRFGEMAAAATDLNIAPADLASNAFYNNADYANYWDTAIGYDIGLINSFGTNNEYVGCAEVLTDRGEHYVPSDLRQTSTVTHMGYKTDMIMNFGFNLSDRLFLGLNMGVPLIEYSNTETIAEVAQTVEDFPVSFTYDDSSTEDTYFSDAAYRYNYYAKGAGIYLKAGLIWLPTNSLRVGLAYQTRTVFSIEESWQHSGMVRYDNGKSYSGSGEEGWYEYTLYTPSVLNAGLAWTFGRRGLLSFDYELTDYARMKFNQSEEFDDVYALENQAIRAFNGPAHSFRAGAEFNLTPTFALRAGASLRTSPEKTYKDQTGTVITYDDYDNDYYLGRKTLQGRGEYNKDYVFGVSGGLGFNPAGSFFADFAVQGTLYPATVFQPYYDYATVYSPRIKQRRLLCAALITIGWRF